jgi:hypothetical protein
MHPRNSPAVRYPLTIRPEPRSGCVVLAALLIAWWMMWLMQGAGFGELQFLRGVAVACLFTVCAYVGGRAWQQWPQGDLYWNGQGWAWEQGPRVVPLHAGPVVVLDVQWLLVLTWRCPGQGVQRFVVMQRTAAHGWSDLRRAVYSPVHPASIDAAAQAK